MDEETQTVWVRRRHNDWRTAEYRLSDVDGVRWDWVGGGVGRRAAYPALYGYVSCEGMLKGELAHSGIHRPCPHSVKVVVTKKDNTAAVYSDLVRRAGPRPVVTRVGRSGSRWTADEDAKLIGSSEPATRLSASMGRSVGAIRARRKALGARGLGGSPGET